MLMLDTFNTYVPLLTGGGKRRRETYKGNLEYMQDMWENTEAICESTYARFSVCGGSRKLFGGVHWVCG